MQIPASPHIGISSDLKALGDPTRLRILGLLQQAGELCVCHVEAALEITQSRASRHLAALRRAGFVTDRRDGAWVHYRIAATPGPLQAAVLTALEQLLDDDPATAADAARAREIRCAEEPR